MFLKKIIGKYSFVAKMSQVVKRQAERAKTIQSNVQMSYYSAEVESKLRKKVTIESSIQELQKEMRQQIARALKQSESKVIYFIKKAEEKFEQLSKAMKNDKQIQQYNELIQKCEKARWEFMVHRQAVGFTIKNYEIVTSLYKIPPKMI